MKIQDIEFFSTVRPFNRYSLQKDNDKITAIEIDFDRQIVKITTSLRKQPIYTPLANVRNFVEEEIIEEPKKSTKRPTTGRTKKTTQNRKTVAKKELPTAD